MPRERQVDKIKVCGEPVSHLCTDHVVYKHDNSHFLLGGVTQVLGTMYLGCQALKDTELSAWGRTKHICAGKSVPHAALQSALGAPGLHLLW